MSLFNNMAYKQHLSHNQESNDRAVGDPLCENVGTLRGLADMLNGGISLDSQAAWDAWPEQLPLLVWHGAADPICDPIAAKRFGENAAAKDKQVEMFEVSLYYLAIGELCRLGSNSRIEEDANDRDCTMKYTTNWNPLLLIWPTLLLPGSIG